MTRKIVVVAEHRDGQLKGITKEALSAALQFAGDPASVSAVLLGQGVDSLAEELAQWAPGGVVYFEGAEVEQYTPEVYVATIKDFIGESGAELVFTGNSYQAIDFFPRLAAAMDAPLVPDCTAVETDGDRLVFIRKVMNGKLDARCVISGSGPALVSLQQGAFPPTDPPGGGVVEKRTPKAGEIPPRKILSIQPGETGEVDLTEAEIIVAGGRGVGDEEKFKIVFDLAEAIGGAVGASRPPCDSGWVEPFRQIGSSGQVVAPKLYIALGISGAIQHLVGMRGSQCIVAINRDPNAPIFQEATYGLVGDLHEIVPALIEAVKEAQEA